jgi:peroxiredoxin
MQGRPLSPRHHIAGLALAMLGLLWLTTVTAEEVENPCPMGEEEAGVLERLGGSCPSPNSGNLAPGLADVFELTLPAPKGEAAKAKLGLDASADSFRPTDLETDAFVLLIFDLYCHACQQSAKNMRWLNDQIENDPNLRKAAVIGLGRGDTPFEVEAFMKKLHLDFPAVSDRDKAFTDALGVDRTPSGYLICRRTGEYHILATFTGYLSRSKAEAFLAPMQSSANTSE